jgi:hypothetical protein
MNSSTPKGKRIQLPLVRSDRPGSIHLTGERIAEILDQEDIASLRSMADPDAEKQD